MTLFWHAVLALIICLSTYWWYAVVRVRKQLKWVQRVPGLPILGNILDFRLSTVSLKTMTGYGEKYNGLCYVQFVTRYLIVASNAKFLEFLLSSHDILEKSRDYRFLHSWLGQGLLTSAGKRWKQSRKIITPAFHFSILEQFVEVFESNAVRMVKKLEKEVEKEIDIFPYVTMYALDVICESAMGVSINAQENKDSEYVFAVKEMCRITVDRTFSPIKMFDFLYPLTKDYYKEKQYVKLLHSRTQAVIDKRRKELRLHLDKKNDNANKQTDEGGVGTKKKMAFLDLLLQSNIDGEPLPDDYIREEVDTFMFEGHDTTTAAISFTLYCLSNHQDVQEKVFQEQLDVFDNNLNQPESYRLLQEMKYLELVIKETLRIYPSVPFYSREAVKDVVTKDGNIIPKGVAVIIFAFGVNRDPTVFDEPGKFNPDRFNNIDVKSPYSYLPFSAGPRNCIGQKFAMLEIKSVISKVVRSFRILPTNPAHEPILAAEAVLKSVNGLKVKLTERKKNY